MTKKGWEMTYSEFNRHFEANMTAYPTYKSAYEAVEQLHKSETGKRKYSCYRSFEYARRRRMKQNK